MTKKVPKTFFLEKTYFKVRSGTNGLKGNKLIANTKFTPLLKQYRNQSIPRPNFPPFPSNGFEPLKASVKEVLLQSVEYNTGSNLLKMFYYTVLRTEVRLRAGTQTLCWVRG